MVRKKEKLEFTLKIKTRFVNPKLGQAHQLFLVIFLSSTFVLKQQRIFCKMVTRIIFTKVLLEPIMLYTINTYF
jgi:hypothetical protein